MSNPQEVRADDGDTDERKLFVTVHDVPNPVLYSKDIVKIKEDSGGRLRHGSVNTMGLGNCF